MIAACWHCGGSLPPDPPQASVGGSRHSVCCNGCRAVAEWIGELGLADYYRLRSASAPRAEDPAESDESAAAFSRPELSRHFVRTLADGKSEAMTSQTVTVPMPDGQNPVTRTLWSTRWGPVFVVPARGITWSGQTAFALKDANRGNQRGIETWLRIGEAKNVGEVEAAVSETLGIPWVNTIAADRFGNALHADVTAVPNVSAEKAKTCATPISTRPI